MTSHRPNDELPDDHDDRIERARLSLTGLSIGDAFGECFFSAQAEWLISSRALPKEPWRYTDDTAMARSIVETLDGHGSIDCDDLAQRFAKRYRGDPNRGYGGMAHHILNEIGNGVPWQEAAVELLGNGSLVLSWDTAPFAVWCAARSLDSFEEALWATVSGLGDRDTTCAMVGSIVALSAGREGIPQAWVEALEPLDR